MHIAAQVAAIIATGYLLGSIPTANIVMHLARHRDLRKVGTGSVTSTAVMLHGGRLIGSVSLAGEIIKTFICLAVAYYISGGELWGMLLMLVAASVGQIWSVWLGGAGGRGQTIFATGFVVLCPLPFLLSVLVLGALVLTTKRFFLSNLVWHLITPPILLLAYLFNPAVFGLGEHHWGYAATAAVLCAFFLIKNRPQSDDIIQTQAWGTYSR
jgi:glycerol-3-phosphate acyltransferase PlsY